MQEQKRTFLQKLIDTIQNKSVSHLVRPEDPKPKIDLNKLAEALAHNETRGVKGDPYKFSRPSGDKNLGKALGKYQVTEGDLKTYAQRYIGQPISSKEFLASSTAQDNYIKNKAKYFADKGYSPDQIADIHRSGFTNSGAPGSTTIQNPAYVESFNKVYKATTTQASR